MSEKYILCSGLTKLYEEDMNYGQHETLADCIDEAGRCMTLFGPNFNDSSFQICKVSADGKVFMEYYKLNGEVKHYD